MKEGRKGGFPVFPISRAEVSSPGNFLLPGPLSRDVKPDPEIYEELIESRGYPGEFSPSFTELQRHFVKSRPVKLKNLLRLVKFWYMQVRAGRIGRGEWAQSGTF